jgi:hypothetical protein
MAVGGKMLLYPSCLPEYCPRLFSSVGEWSRSWLAFHCPSRASRWAVMGSSEPWLKKPFGGRWTSAKSMFVSAVKKAN